MQRVGIGIGMRLRHQRNFVAALNPVSAQIGRHTLGSAPAKGMDNNHEMGLRRRMTQCNTCVSKADRMPWARLAGAAPRPHSKRSEEHTSELQPLMRISSAVFCLKKTTK